MDKPTYAPLPARAMADDELTALDFRVLMAVASHDRFNKNGRGCCPRHSELARKAKCEPKSLSRSLRKITERGYIQGLPSPVNKRRRAYRVIYNDADRAIMKGNQMDTYHGSIGNQNDTKNPSIGNNGVFKSQQNQILATPYKRFSETKKRFNEIALLRNEETEFQLQDSDGQFLGGLQTWLRAMSGKGVTPAEVLELQQKRDRCTELEDLHGNEKIGGWAQRLGTDIDIRLESEPDHCEFIGEVRSFAIVTPCGAARRVGVRTMMRGARAA